MAIDIHTAADHRSVSFQSSKTLDNGGTSFSYAKTLPLVLQNQRLFPQDDFKCENFPRGAWQEHGYTLSEDLESSTTAGLHGGSRAKTGLTFWIYVGLAFYVIDVRF